MSSSRPSLALNVMIIKLCAQNYITVQQLSYKSYSCFDLCNVVPRVLRQYQKRFFLMQCCLEPLGKRCIVCYQFNVVLRLLRTHYRGFFLIQKCLELPGKRWIRFCPVQCFPKSIKTTLHRIFSYVMLSGVSGSILHRVFVCEILS